MSRRELSEDRVLSAPLPATSTSALIGAMACGLFLVLVAASWIGFLGSDDWTYARGAYGWLNEGWYVGGHGTIRYTITLPIALSFAVLGEHEVALVLPSLLYALAMVIVAYRAVLRYAGMWTALVAILAVVTNPLLVVQSSLAGIDVIELLFLFSSFLFFSECVLGRLSLGKLFAAGAFAGLGFLTRETSIFIAPFYGILFLAGYGFKRRYYWVIAGGFLAVWAVELAYLTIMTGDPLYRFNISLHHDSTIDRTVDEAGNLIVHPVVDPLLVLLVNQEFAFLYWIGVPLALWLCFAAPIDLRLKRFCRLLALFGLVWFVCVGAAVALLPLNPRYFMITTVAMCLLTGIALAQAWLTLDRRRLALGLGAVLLLGNLGGLYVDNNKQMFGERRLVEVAAEHEVVYTDPQTRHRATLLLQWRGLESRALAAPPPPGSVYLYNPYRADHPSQFMRSDEVALYQPKPDWQAERQMAPAPPGLAVLMERIGLDDLLPQAIWRKLRYRHPGVTIYRVPAA